MKQPCLDDCSPHDLMAKNIFWHSFSYRKILARFAKNTDKTSFAYFHHIFLLRGNHGPLLAKCAWLIHDIARGHTCACTHVHTSCLSKLSHVELRSVFQEYCQLFTMAKITTRFLVNCWTMRRPPLEGRRQSAAFKFV